MSIDINQSNDDFDDKHLKELREKRVYQLKRFGAILKKGTDKLDGDSLREIGGLISKLLDESTNHQQEQISSRNISKTQNNIVSADTAAESDSKDISYNDNLSDEKLLEFQLELEELVKELYSLLAEIGGLLSELGNPPDKQKLILLKEKLRALQLTRSKMGNLKWKVPLKYHKMFDFDYHFENMDSFLKENQSTLAQFGKDSKLSLNKSLMQELELILEREVLFEQTYEQLYRLQEELENTTDAQRINEIQAEIGMLLDQQSDLQIQIKQQKQMFLSNNHDLENQADAVSLEVELELAASAVFAELNGLIQAQSYGSAELLKGNSINFHKTYAEILDAFDAGDLLVEGAHENRNNNQHVAAIESLDVAGHNESVSNNIVKNENTKSLDNDSVEPKPSF